MTDASFVPGCMEQVSTIVKQQTSTIPCRPPAPLRPPAPPVLQSASLYHVPPSPRFTSPGGRQATPCAVWSYPPRLSFYGSSRRPHEIGAGTSLSLR
ncbi:hypothetical protein RRG08_034379 [Elysia crispata]|uniref:Uncharacterized protein n=1 Tax=Elysia crispata TaxID=231223 RepID=A0AAE0YDB8_9GAST|nr:hypothetical protein RRG08_034379 [Elysia crispata]